MQFLAELLFQIVFETVAYGIGRAFLLVFAPHIGSELEVSPSPKHSWKWRGWTFQRDGRKYFYVESVQLVGLLVAAVLALLVALIAYLKG